MFAPHNARWVQQFDGSMARHAEGLIGIEPLGRSGLAHSLHPLRDLPAIQPDVIARIAPMR